MVIFFIKCFKVLMEAPLEKFLFKKTVIFCVFVFTASVINCLANVAKFMNLSGRWLFFGMSSSTDYADVNGQFMLKAAINE